MLYIFENKLGIFQLHSNQYLSASLRPVWVCVCHFNNISIMWFCHIQCALLPILKIAIALWNFPYKTALRAAVEKACDLFPPRTFCLYFQLLLSSFLSIILPLPFSETVYCIYILPHPPVKVICPPSLFTPKPFFLFPFQDLTSFLSSSFLLFLTTNSWDVEMQGGAFDNPTKITMQY